MKVGKYKMRMYAVWHVAQCYLVFVGIICMEVFKYTC